MSKGTVYRAVAVHRAACIGCQCRKGRFKKGNAEVFKSSAVYGAAAVHEAACMCSRIGCSLRGCRGSRDHIMSKAECSLRGCRGSRGRIGSTVYCRCQRRRRIEVHTGVIHFQMVAVGIVVDPHMRDTWMGLVGDALEWGYIYMGVVAKCTQLP